MMTVADYIADFLVRKGIKHIFGFQGGAILKILDAIVATNEIKYIQNFNEQASSFCADAYARIRNDIGVAIATSGPGAANLISGIANAYFDSVPALFITGNDYTGNILNRKDARQNGFQDLDIVSVVKPISKYAVLITDKNDIRYELEKAYYLATNGRKGSVVLDVPVDIQFQEIDPYVLKSFEEPKVVENTFDLSRFFDAIENAQRPVILAGGGVRSANAENEFYKFVEKTNIPVITTLNGKDVYDKSYGFSGLHGNSVANLAILKADLLIVMGARMGQRQVGKAPEKYTRAKVIHIDIDETEINRICKTDLFFKTDLKSFIQTALAVQKSFDFSEWKKEIDALNEKYADTILVNHKGVEPISFVRDCASILSNQTIFTSDVGQNQMWVAQALNFKKGQRFLTSSGFGAMGYSLPAAIGASYLSNNPVIAFTGDGGFQMNLQELNALSLLKRNVKCIVFNNNTLGLMREVQKRYYNSHYYGSNPAEFCCPDLEKIAFAFNLPYLQIKEGYDKQSLEKALLSDTPYLIDVHLDLDTSVLNRYDDVSFKQEGYL